MKQLAMKLVFGFFVFGLILLSFGYTTLEALAGAACFGVASFIVATIMSNRK